MYWFLTWTQYVLIGVVAIIGLIGVAWEPAPDDWPKWVIATQKIVSDHSAWTLPTIPALIGVLQLCRKAMGPPWLWSTVESVLRRFQSQVFGDMSGNPSINEHRITLFQWRRWKLRLGRRYYCGWLPLWKRQEGWLVPVARSGGQKCTTAFFAPKDKTDFEGITGAAWKSIHGRPIYEKDLPDLHVTNLPSSDIEEYAKRTYYSEEHLRARLSSGKPCARSFFAVRVEVSQRPWGVLVIDSREPTIPSPQKALHDFMSTAGFLGIILEK